MLREGGREGGREEKEEEEEEEEEEGGSPFTISVGQVVHLVAQ